MEPGIARCYAISTMHTVQKCKLLGDELWKLVCRYRLLFYILCADHLHRSQSSGMLNVNIHPKMTINDFDNKLNVSNHLLNKSFIHYPCRLLLSWKTFPCSIQMKRTRCYQMQIFAIFKIRGILST